MNKGVIRAAIGIIVVLAFLAVVGGLFFHLVPAENQRYIDVALGALIVLAKEVVQWYFGSSQGSEEKTAFLMKDKGGA